jgi:hypothetical protein
MRSLIIDNFLPYPQVVRSWALQQTFLNAAQMSDKLGVHTSWPGVRTDHVMDLDAAYADHVLNQISQLAQQNYSGAGGMNIKSYFQICTQQDGDSWVHQDNDVHVAGVLYLTPNAPISSGTTTYACRDPHQWHSLHIDQMRMINQTDRQDLYDQLFEPVDCFGNVFNRLIMYPGIMFHKSNLYFGSDKQTGRLTQVFFVKFDS